MGTKQYKPTSPALRTRSVVNTDQLTDKSPEKALLTKLNKKAGRNNQGRVTTRHQGGGTKRKYRQIDFKRQKDNVPGIISSLEYDPNRSAFISLVKYKDGDKRYILSPVKMKIGDTIHSGPDAEIKIGNTLPLGQIPAGSTIHNVELSIGKGGQIARSAGTSAILQGKSAGYASVKLPSGEVRLINLKCRATIGQVGNTDNRNQVIGKAGANRWRRKRPTVRGSVMNACDHPHGGGEGRAPIGRSGPMTPWGKPTLGYKTRNKRKGSSRFIVRRRK